MRILRRSLLLAVLALVALPFTAVGSSAQQQSEFTVTVKKVVVGTGAASAVTVDCSGVSDEATAQVVDVLNFDAQGNPVASGADTDFAIEGGAWVLVGSPGSGFECTFNETVTGGAASTSWTCAYTATPTSAPTAQIELAGCDAAAGANAGPVDVTYPGSQDVSVQASTVVFTNTFGSAPPNPPAQPASQVVAKPAFTG